MRSYTCAHSLKERKVCGGSLSRVVLTTPGALVPMSEPFWVSFFNLVIITVFIAAYGTAQVLKVPRLTSKALSVEFARNVTGSAPTWQPKARVTLG